MQIEAASREIIARAGTCLYFPCHDRLRNAPEFAIELDELAARSEPVELLEEQSPLLAAAKAKLADQLLVSGFFSRQSAQCARSAHDRS